MQIDESAREVARHLPLPLLLSLRETLQNFFSQMPESAGERCMMCTIKTYLPVILERQSYLFSTWELSQEKTRRPLPMSRAILHSDLKTNVAIAQKLLSVYRDRIARSPEPAQQTHQQTGERMHKTYSSDKAATHNQICRRIKFKKNLNFDTRELTPSYAREFASRRFRLQHRLLSEGSQLDFTSTSGSCEYEGLNAREDSDVRFHREYSQLASCWLGWSHN